jgi:hypothetical protein
VLRTKLVLILADVQGLVEQRRVTLISRHAVEV